MLHQFGSRMPPDDMEAGIGEALADQRQDAGRNAQGCIDIGRIIHLPGEDQPGVGKFRELRLGFHRDRIEQHGIDAIAQHAYIGKRSLLWAEPRREQFGLGRRDQQADIGARRQPGFLIAQHPCLARFDPAQRRMPFGGIGVEFGRIDIDKVGNHPAGEARGYILAHLPGEHIDR